MPRTLPLCVVLACLASGCTRSGPTSTGPAVTLRVVTYDELIAAVKAQRGKVVVVDIWGEF